MIIVSLVGLKKSGKTTCAEALIREFKNHGFKVGGVKFMPHGSIDPEGKDTWRQKTAGADFVVSLSQGEVGYIQPVEGRATLEDAMHLVPEDTDILVCEGYNTDDEKVQKIIVCKSIDTLEETFEVRGKGGRIIALSGIMTNDVKEHTNYPVYNCTNPDEVTKLVELILKGE